MAWQCVLFALGEGGQREHEKTCRVGDGQVSEPTGQDDAEGVVDVRMNGNGGGLGRHDLPDRARLRVEA